MNSDKDLTEVTHSNTNTNRQSTRPAGGTARTSGTKTPRKVQWAVSQPGDDGVHGVDATHALDEHGLDVRIRHFRFRIPLAPLALFPKHKANI